jgi:hypothetical protein
MTRQYGSKSVLPEIESHLLAQERILWLGKPSFTRLLHVPVEGVEPIATLIIGSIVTFFVAFVLMIGEVSALLALPIVLVVGLVASVPAISAYYRQRDVVYAVTTHRAIIMENGEITSFGAGDIQKLQMKDLQDGTGDIIFKTVVKQHLIPNGYMPYPVEVEESIGFFGVYNPRHVYGMLLETFRTSSIPMWQDLAEAVPSFDKSSAHA